MTRPLWTIASASLAALLIASCSPTEPAPAAQAPAAPAAPAAPDYVSLLAAADRTQADKDRDAARKPAEVLAFARIMSGQSVVDLEAGGGYYTELLAKAVGQTGKVTLQMPKEFTSFYQKDIDTRTANARLPNVTLSLTSFDKLEAADASIDVVTWFQGPHELFCKKECGDAAMGEPGPVFTEIARVLKPGGYLVVMDHVAKQGTPTTSGNDQHRIDPMQVKALATAANFALEEESALLASPADDYTKSVFDPAVRGKTDQFLMRFKKP